MSWLLAIDWATTGKTVLGALIGAGLGSALVQGVFSLMAERRRRTAQATYLAMRLAVLLDAFGLACSHRHHSGDPSGHALSELPPYPEDSEGWSALDSALAIRCLQLRSRRGASENLLHATADLYSDGSGEIALAKQEAGLGLEARRLAKDLAGRYGFDSGAGDYVPSLERTLKQTRHLMRPHDGPTEPLPRLDAGR